MSVGVGVGLRWGLAAGGWRRMLLGLLGLLPGAAGALEPLRPPPMGPDASARDGIAGHFSVVTGETVAPGRDLFSGELGFPGFTAGYARGINERFDVGAKVDLLYGLRYTTLQTQAGLAVHVALRYMVYRRGALSLQAHAEPGLDFYSGPYFGILLPFGVTAGFQATPELRLSLGADLPLAFNYSNVAFLQAGTLFGGGVEYFVEQNWSAGLNLRFGPQAYTLSGSTPQLGFVAQVVIGYRK